MKPINGWAQAEMKLLAERTGQPDDAIERFCQAVDKQLYLMLPTHMKRATLHFHLLLHKPTDTSVETETLPALKFVPGTKPDKVIQLQDYRHRRKA
jgi:hypothetical protein